ncbi:MAG TPA: hypothetical protein VIB48_08945 [Acidimicrobiia bacterium]|jgi:hypothetical protein
MGPTVWDDVLADLEARLDACRELLDADLDAVTAAYLRDLRSGEPVPTPATLIRFAPPRDLGPVPPEKAARAQALLQRGAELERELAERRDTVAARLHAITARQSAPRARSTTPPAPRLLDRLG